MGSDRSYPRNIMNRATKKAVALKYQQGVDYAPKVIAKGDGKLAQRLIEKAKEFDVPIFQNEALAQSLLREEVGSSIPPRLYHAIVEIFAWLHHCEEQAQASL